MSMLFAAMMGWCGTKWPGWWRIPRPPVPDPEPWWHGIMDGIVGAIGGVGAGIVFAPMLGDAGLAVTGATAFFGGVFLGGLVRDVMGASRG